MFVYTGTSVSEECETLVKKGSSRCSACVKFRRALNLRLLRRRSTSLNQRVDPQSHTSYKWLSPEEKQQRMQALHAKVKALSYKNEQLEHLLRAESCITVDKDTHNDLLTIMEEKHEDALQASS